MGSFAESLVVDAFPASRNGSLRHRINPDNPPAPKPLICRTGVMKHRHEEDTRNLKKWLLFLFAYAVSMTMLVVGLYASEVLNKTSEQLILVTVIIHGIYLYLRSQRDT